MRKYGVFCLLVAVIVAFSYSSCKKSGDSTPTKDTTALSPFAKALAASCTHPFAMVVDSSSYALPTAFSPNGDGINDVFSLMGIFNTISSFQMSIYKTDGTRIFQGTTYTQYWNGKDSAGHKCTDYKYYVKIQLVASDANIDTGSYIYLLHSNSTTHCDSTIAADKPYYLFPDQFNPVNATFPYATNEVFCN